MAASEMTPEREKDLLQRWRSGDGDAAAELWGHLLAGLRICARRYKRWWIDPDDLLQETYRRCHESVIEGHFDFARPERFRYWVQKVLRNVFRERLRERTSASLSTIEDHMAFEARYWGTDPQQRLEVMEACKVTQHALQQYIKKLPPGGRERQVIAMYFGPELSGIDAEGVDGPMQQTDIVRRLGMRRQNVSQHVVRARQQVTKVLKRRLPAWHAVAGISPRTGVIGAVIGLLTSALSVSHTKRRQAFPLDLVRLLAARSIPRQAGTRDTGAGSSTPSPSGIF